MFGFSPSAFPVQNRNNLSARSNLTGRFAGSPLSIVMFTIRLRQDAAGCALQGLLGVFENLRSFGLPCSTSRETSMERPTSASFVPVVTDPPAQLVALQPTAPRNSRSQLRSSDSAILLDSGRLGFRTPVAQLTICQTRGQLSLKGVPFGS